MLLARSLLFTAVFYINTAVFLLLGSWLLFAPRSWAMAGLKAHARASLFWMRLICGTTLEVRGLEHLPDRPFLIAAKHQSAWDTFALIPVFADPALVMKAELMKLPLYGWFSTKFGMIPIKRETGPSALREMLREAQMRLDDKREILVFPEGTRRLAGAEPDYKPGILMMYDKLSVPCVPLALNSGLFWPRNSQLRNAGTIVVEILPAIPAGLKRKEFAAQLESTVETATATLVDEAIAANQELARHTAERQQEAGSETKT
ncbi:MAG: lysophospholipid acyltransferase family protein [Pseudomonadota bacterium]